MKTTSIVLSLSLALPGVSLSACSSVPMAIIEQGGEGARSDLEHQNLGKDGLAIAGYDPVSYFEAGGSTARKGKPELSLQERGVIYRFATAEHLALFKANPARFEPAYGGWCAYAVAKGSKVGIDPNSFLIQDGRLLLFYRGFLNDTRKTWSATPAEFGVQADEYWEELIQAE